MSLSYFLKKFRSLPTFTKFVIIFYPFFLIWWMIKAWVAALWEARILTNGQWHRYMGFHPKNSVNNLFYRTQWVNLNRYGRRGVSPILGLGSYPLKQWFHLSLLSSYFYAHAGAVTTLLGTFFWTLSHIVWIGQVETTHIFVVVLLLFLSSTSYLMAFVVQNYQILSWMWFPLGLFGIYTEDFVLACVSWFFSGLMGVTSVFFAVPVALVMSFTMGSWAPALALVPGVIMVASRFFPLIIDGGSSNAISSFGKLIGATKRKVRYNREMHRIDFVSFYFLILYTGSCFLFSLSIGEVAILPFLGALLFMINQRFFRVADHQSLYILNATIWASEVISSDPSFLNYIIFWVAVSPFPLVLNHQRLVGGRSVSNVFVYPPFDTSVLLADLKHFLENVDAGVSVYAAFPDPSGRYVNLFNGYGGIHEALLSVAAEKGVHIFPDWYAVAETNYSDAPQCWGCSIQEVIDQCEQWNSQFVVLYSGSNHELDEQWLQEFNCLATFDWTQYANLVNGIGLWSIDKSTPRLFLLHRVVRRANQI